MNNLTCWDTGKCEETSSGFGPRDMLGLFWANSWLVQKTSGPVSEDWSGGTVSGNRLPETLID